jgi:ATP-dependent Clp protease ATP-binding subunit ClpA
MKKLSPNNGIFLKFETLRSRLKDMIYDQDEAIDEVVDAFIHTACKFDMSQYTAPEDGDRLIGQKHTPDGAADGELTAFLKKHPKSIIVFNNIEMAA